MTINEHNLVALYFKYNVNNIEEIDSLLHSRLIDVIELIEAIDNAGLDDEKHFPKSAAYINSIKEKV